MRKFDKIYERERKVLVKNLLIILVILVSLNLLFLIFANFSFTQEIQEEINITEEQNETKENESIIDSEEDKTKEIQFLELEDAVLVEIRVPAVNSKGEGVSTIISVEITEGSGRTFVDIENLLFWADTQQSIRMARYVAGQITKKSLDNYDMVYNIKAEANVIGGPSAGSALTIATIFALEGLNPKEEVFISGTINHDGSIGHVSEIVEKTKASKEAGAEIFLVPLLQSRGVVYETKEHCQEFGTSQVCKTETRPIQIDLKEKYGIDVIEVGSIREALDYFLREGDDFSF
jgi:uncharacterized protein